VNVLSSSLFSVIDSSSSSTYPPSLTPDPLNGTAGYLSFCFSALFRALFALSYSLWSLMLFLLAPPPLRSLKVIGFFPGSLSEANYTGLEPPSLLLRQIFSCL
jgi:hypothetical protein